MGKSLNLSAPGPGLEELELRLLLEGVFAQAGYDFRSYLAPMLRRRVWQCVREEGLRTISGFQEKVLHNSDCMARLVQALCINVSSLFRDPGFYCALRQEIFPRLHTYPFLRIWHAGCASGEEAFSTAILLEEEGLYDRCRIYATDINLHALEQARRGVIPAAAVEASAKRYREAGGRRVFSKYYTLTNQGAVLDPSLRRNLVFSQHNLVTDGSFNAFNVICCRNVLIYFNRPLQDRVHELLYKSLVMFGVLALGTKESLQFSPYEHAFKQVNGEQRLYCRIT